MKFIYLKWIIEHEKLIVDDDYLFFFKLYIYYDKLESKIFQINIEEKNKQKKTSFSFFFLFCYHNFGIF